MKPQRPKKDPPINQTYSKITHMRPQRPPKKQKRTKKYPKGHTGVPKAPATLNADDQWETYGRVPLEYLKEGFG